MEFQDRHRLPSQFATSHSSLSLSFSLSSASLLATTCFSSCFVSRDRFDEFPRGNPTNALASCQREAEVNSETRPSLVRGGCIDVSPLIRDSDREREGERDEEQSEEDEYLANISPRFPNISVRLSYFLRPSLSLTVSLA